jgi:hypothetical protein
MRWNSSLRKVTARAIFSGASLSPCSMFQMTSSFSLSRCFSSTPRKRAT